MKKLAKLPLRRGEYSIWTVLFRTQLTPIALLCALIMSAMIQPPTPAEAAALWAQSLHKTASHAPQGVPAANVDPPYQPPAKHGTNYVAPTPKKSSGATKSERTNLRTRTSRTFSDAGHQLTTLIYAESVNYRDATGTWQAIDDSLVKTGTAGYAYQNRANRYVAFLPADIASAPIRVELGSAWITFDLKGARGATAVTGATATYADALPGVSVVVTAQADALEEAIVLRDPRAQATFVYQIQTSPGLKAKKSGNALLIVDASGRPVFAFAAPGMYDSSKKAGGRSSSLALTTNIDSTGTTVQLTADPNWLADRSRKWPVTIDPTVILSDSQDCYINAGSPTTSFCGGASLNAGFDGTNAFRSLLQFNLSVVPTTNTVVSAKLYLFLGSASTGNATTLSAYQLTRSWTSAATWNAHDGTNSWTSPGGDFSGTAAATTNGIAATGAWYTWSPTALVQGWVNGTIANNGLIVKEPTENVTNVLSFNSATGTNPPYLQIVHQQGGSTPGAYATTVQADSPLAYWHLDEASGSTMNDAENADPGTYQGGFTLAQTPLIQPAAGTSVAFNGSTGYATAPTLTTLQGDNTRSIELWVQTSTQSAQSLIDVGAGAGSSNQMFSLIAVPQGWVTNNPPGGISLPGVYVALWTQDVYFPGINIEDGKRHHLVLELVGNNIWLYVDGATPGAYWTNTGGNDTFAGSWGPNRYLQQQPVTLSTTPNTGANPILIGNGRYVGTSMLNGIVDEVAVYSTALSATQVQNHWQAGNGLSWSPTAVTAVAGQNQVTVSWTAPTFNAGGITGYVLTPQVGSNLRTPITFNSSATSETISNLSGGTAYAFTVTAFSSLGLGVPSNLSGTATPSGPALVLYEDTVLADSPVGFWPFGETSFNTATDLTQTYNGQFYGGYSQGDVGPVINYPNKATNLSGTSAYVRFNHSALLEPAAVTVEFWIKPTSIPVNDAIILVSPEPGENSTNGYVMTFDGTNNGQGGKVTWAGITTTAALPLSVWSYVVGVTDSTATRLYVNGKESSAVGGVSPNYGATTPFDAQLARYSFPGDFADLAIYSSSLSSSQVAGHYAAAGYAPGPVSNLVATASTNSASLTWTTPSYIGPSPITSYTVTPVVDGKTSTPISISGNGTGANIPNLPGGASYAFQVQANSASGVGNVVTSAGVTVNSPSAGPGQFGTNLYLRGTPTTTQAFSHYGFVSRNNAPALATWTIEGRMWGIQPSSTNGSHMFFGYLGGTTSNPSDDAGVAGLEFRLSATTSYFVWPGGSCQITTDVYGVPGALDVSTNTPAHVALTYDGTTVRGFINGAIAVGPPPNNTPCSVTTGSAALPAAPFGFFDHYGLVQGSFDEFRVSSTARWTSNFTSPGQQYTPPYDSNTMILWHFNDYQISKLPSTHIIPDQNDAGIFASGIIPSTYRDSSGNTNHANTVWSTSHTCACLSEDWRRPYSLGQGVTADELTGGESNWLCPCTISSTARPVNNATGEFYHTFTDFHIPGRVDLDFNHTYSSLRAATNDPIGPIGYGWTDNYNEYLSIDGSSNATVHEPNGSAVLFTFDAVQNTYSAPPSEHVALVKNGDSTFTLTDAGLNQTIFNAPDASNISTLQKQLDRHHSAAYTISVSHNGDRTPGVVTDPAGRTLMFSYSTITGFRLVTITDSGTPARTVTLQIGNDPSQPTTYNDLTQVTDVAGGLTKFTYDTNHYLVTMTDPNNGVTTNHYDPTSHQITSQDDPMSPTRTTTFSYSGGLTTITDPKGNVIQEEYLNGMLLSRTIGYGTAQAATWTYAFDPAAVGLTAAVGPNGETLTTVRDASANILSSTDGIGRTTSYTYNSFREPLTIQDPTGVTTTNVYNATGDLTSTSRPLVGTGQTQTITYNRSDVSHPSDVTSMVDADNKTWTYTYDSNGYRNSVRDPLGNLATNVFNSNGFMTSSTSPNGNTSRRDTFVRTPVSGSWGTATDGNIWTKQAGSATYSTTGTQGKIAKPSSDSWESLGPVLANDGGEVLVRWQVATTSDKAGAVLRLSSGAATFYGVRFDGAGHVELFGKWGGTIHTNIGSARINYTPGTTQQWFRFRVVGNTLYFKVWTNGSAEPANWSGQTTDTNVTGIGFAGLYGNATNTTGVKFDSFAANPYATTTYTYNSFGQRTGLTDPENHTTTWHYDPNQNLDRVTDPDGNLTTNVYDADNELTQVKRADSPQTILITDYNADGTVLDNKDGKGNAIQSYQYDSLAHVTTVTDGLGNVITYVYNAYGNLFSRQDPGGNCSAQPSNGCTTYSYDAGNQLTSIQYSDGVTPSVTRITYDADGQRTAVTDGTGTSTWGWDSLHRMVSYTNGNGAQVQWVYNLRNLATTITYPGSLNVTRGYDAASRWTSVQDWNTNSTTFTYDPDSNLSTETFPAASGVVDSFTFNAADQLTAVTSAKVGSPLFSASYTRDSANLVTGDSSAASGSGSYKYTPLNQVCYAGSGNTNACSAPPNGSIPYAYDAADNLTQKGSSQQVVNNSDELCWTASTSGACGSPPSGATTYQYDTRGNRITVTPSLGQVQSLTYDQANRMTKYAAASSTSYGYNADGLRMCKFSGSSTQPCQAGGNTPYVWDVAGSLPLLLEDGTTAYIYGPAGLPLEQVSGSTTYWYHHDQIGSTRLITDSTGTSQATYVYDPYGGLTSSTGTIANPFRFAGEYQDSPLTESGFYYVRARYYDPATGQFTTLDPAVATTRTPYAYVRGNPLNGTDPSGLDFWGGLQNGMVWVGQHLPGPAKSGYVSAVAGLGARAGDDSDRLHSGDPSQWLQPVSDSVTVALTVTGVVGLGRAVVGCGLRMLASRAVLQAPKPLPPGWTEDWVQMFGTRGGKNWFDPAGGEWRFHPIDKWHPDPHWDYNPWTQWNSPWQKVPLK